MLLQAGIVNPRLDPNSVSRFTRNAVCTIDARHVLLAYTERPLTLYSFADALLSVGCTDALYLDGHLSQMYPFDHDLSPAQRQPLSNLYWHYLQDRAMSRPFNETPQGEQARLDVARTMDAPWRLWGAFLAERAWGSVREDYSADGDAWSYLPHDHSRSRAYRWNEDGMGGICDRMQNLCLSLCMWNGKDKILKERAFGLNGKEGQPRRRRQRNLLLQGRDADPQLA